MHLGDVVSLLFTKSTHKFINPSYLSRLHLSLLSCGAQTLGK